MQVVTEIKKVYLMTNNHHHCYQNGNCILGDLLSDSREEAYSTYRRAYSIRTLTQGNCLLCSGNFY